MNEGKTDIRSDTSVSKNGIVKKTILIFVLFSILTVIKMSVFLHGTEDDEIDDLRTQPWQQKNEGRLQDDETDGRRNQRLVFMDNVTHFLSHIPKSGGTYASSMLQKLLLATVRLPNNRTERDVKMAQATFNRNMYDRNFFAVPEFNQSMFDEGLYWRPEWRRRRMPPVDLTGETDAYTPPFVCDEKLTAVSRFQPYLVRHERKKIRFKCEMWVAEGPWNDIAHNVYTVLREPLSHVLSQYFHCTEVKIRKEMPAMDVWLETYANLKEEFPNKGKVYYDRLRALQKRFRCYNPIDSESVYTAFRYEHLPEEYTYPYPNTENRDEETKKLDKSLIDDLKRRFQIIGDTSQMTKTICAIFIDFTQGKHIPEICDCTHSNGDEDDAHGSGTFFISNLYTDPHTISFQNNRLMIGQKISHGVKHHGSAYLKEMAPDQRELLTTLRSNDLLLYNISRAVFAEQIRDMEARYGIRVCDRWNQPKT